MVVMTIISRIFSIGLLFLIITSGVCIFNSKTSIVYDVKAETEWLQTSDTDFESGVKNNVMIVGDGSDAQITLARKPENWVEQIPPMDPGGKTSPKLSSIYGADKVLLFAADTETWIYDLSDQNWYKRSPSMKPGPRTGFSMAPVFGTDNVVLFGGYESIFYNDTWLYDLSDNTWTKITTPVKPPARYKHDMASIYGKKQVLLFGGINSTYYNDTWIFDYPSKTWERQSPDTFPEGRADHALASFWGTDKILLNGGYGQQNYDDTWIYNVSDKNWKKQTPADKPFYLSQHAMAQIYGTDNLVLFGGLENGYYIVSDTWTYYLSNNSWVKKDLTNNPKSNYGHTMASIYGTDSILKYGGLATSDNHWIFSANLYKNGTYASKRYDCGSPATFLTLAWDSESTDETRVEFQIRSSKTEEGLAVEDFTGPGGNRSGYYSTSPDNIWSGHNGDRWIQYKAFLNTTNITKTPVLKNVTIKYKNWPEAVAESPENGSISAMNKPTFTWTVFDKGTGGQGAFQVIISDSIDFDDILFDSGIIATEEQFWHFTSKVPSSIIPDGKYYWKVRINDNEGYWGYYSDPFMFTIDTKVPYSNVTFPVNGRYYSGLDSIQGTVFDEPFSGGLKDIELILMRSNDNYYWNGITWGPVETRLHVNADSNWSYDTSRVMFNTGANYTVISYAVDNALNKEGLKSGISFYFTQEKPISTMEFPKENGYVNNVTEIRGSAEDKGGSGLSVVKISIMESLNFKYWDGKKWDYPETWLEAEGKETWSYDTSKLTWIDGREYIITTQAFDEAGNQEFPLFDNQFIFDGTAPTNTFITINDHEELTASRSVNLTLDAKDADSGVQMMGFSFDGSTWSEWLPFFETYSLDLQGPDGNNNIYFKVKDRAGNIGEAVSDSIILDTEPPSDLSIAINNGANFTESTYVGLNISAYDNTSGLYMMMFSNDGINWDPWVKFENFSYYSLKPGYGAKYIYIKVADKASNVAGPAVASIKLVEKPGIVDVPDEKIPSEQLDDVHEGKRNYIAVLIVILIISVVLIAVYFALVNRYYLDGLDGIETGDEEEPDNLSEEKKPVEEVTPEISFVPTSDEKGMSRIGDRKEAFESKPKEEKDIIDAVIIPTQVANNKGTDSLHKDQKRVKVRK